MFQQLTNVPTVEAEHVSVVQSRDSVQYETLRALYAGIYLRRWTTGHITTDKRKETIIPQLKPTWNNKLLLSLTRQHWLSKLDAHLLSLYELARHTGTHATLVKMTINALLK